MAMCRHCLALPSKNQKPKYQKSSRFGGILLKIISRKDKNLMSQCSAIPRRLPVFVFICDFYLMSMAFGPCTFLQDGHQAAHTPGLGMEQSLHWVLMFTPQLGAQTTGNLVGPDTNSDPLGSPVSLARNLGLALEFH